MNAQEKPANAVELLQSKQSLAQKALRELGISEQYDRFLDNCLDIAIANNNQNSPFRTWLQQVLVQKAGWKYIENIYVERLTSTFSETELQELLKLSKQPLMKKLLQAQIQAYLDSSQERRRLLQILWEDYQSGKINPPQELFPSGEKSFSR